MNTMERSRAANAAKSAKARRRRFQRVLQEMRETGLVVHVRAEQENGDFIDAPDYTPQATHAAIYH